MEPSVYSREASGWIEVITGSMFSGKTEELIRRLRRARIARQRVEIFKPALDTRYAATFGDAAVVSHDETAIPSQVVHTAEQILLLAADADVVAVDEAQFFDEALVDVCQRLARAGKRVVVAGCLVQRHRAKMLEWAPGIDAMIGLAEGNADIMFNLLVLFGVGALFALVGTYFFRRRMGL